MVTGVTLSILNRMKRKEIYFRCRDYVMSFLPSDRMGWSSRRQLAVDVIKSGDLFEKSGLRQPLRGSDSS